MTLDDVLEARARNWEGVSEVEFADHLSWLIDRVRDQDEALRIMHEDRLKMVEELAALKRAHAWFVKRMHIGDRGGWNPCGGNINCEHSVCEYAKARDLIL